MDFGNDVQRIALDLIERFGDLAAPIARELATASDAAHDEMALSSETWRAIINTIEFLYPTQ
jgi:hypothetical protein